MSFTTQQPDPEQHAILSNAGWQHLMISDDHFGEVNSLEKLSYERVESIGKTGLGDTPALRLKAFKEWANSRTPIASLTWHDDFFFEQEVPDRAGEYVLVYFEPEPQEREVEMNDDQKKRIRLIKSGHLSVNALEELLKTTNDQLRRYEQALNLWERTDAENWTYDAFMEIMRLSSGREPEGVDPRQWNLMLTSGKLKLRTSAGNNLHEGLRMAEEIKTALETELAKKK